LSDIVAFERRGWELVVSNLTDAAKSMIQDRVAAIVPLTDQRYTLELPGADPPARVIADLAAAGVNIVSLNPIRTTLEDYYVSLVGSAAPRDLSGVARS
jgi:hypothetical protein